MQESKCFYTCSVGKMLSIAILLSLFVITSATTLQLAPIECYPKWLYRSRAGNHFYRTEYEIWADFGPVGNIEKKMWADDEQLFSATATIFLKKIKNLPLET